MQPITANLQDVLALRDRGAVFFVSHSGGKDSQAMYLAIARYVPHDQIVVVHADLGRVEWHGTQDHIRNTISHRLNVVHAVWQDGSRKELLDMVARRAEALAAKGSDAAPWPSSSQRYCTSDLKRGPIEKFIRGELKRRGATLGVNAMGLRAQESANRAKKPTLTLNARLSKAGREVWDWLPIHTWLDGDVFATIDEAGQQPHYAYGLGNERLSCVFCIFGCDGDLANGARQRPELAREYIDLERRTGATLFHKAALSDRIAAIDITE